MKTKPAPDPVPDNPLAAIIKVSVQALILLIEDRLNEVALCKKYFETYPDKTIQLQDDTTMKVNDWKANTQVEIIKWDAVLTALKNYKD